MRGRLWAALALLSVAVLSASAVTWIALQRVDARLQDLHQETLSQVAQAIDLSKRSSDLATSAPYLLNQRSNFLIEQEGAKLLSVLDRVRTDWPETRVGNAQDTPPPVSDILDSMTAGVSDLVAASRNLDALQAQLREQTAVLGILRNTATMATAAPAGDDTARLIWWSLQSMNADALNAAYAGNLISVGEEQRHYLRQRETLEKVPLQGQQEVFLDQLEDAVWGVAGIFELRRLELSSNLEAQNALFRIRRDANRINELAGEYADQAEAFLASERAASSRTIWVARMSVAAISAVSLALAMTAAIYVSQYVTFNITRVSAAMVRLANGDRASALPRRLDGKDEIGDLFRSFRSFRANALRLDRSNRQLDQRNALFEKVFTNISDGIAIADAAGRVTARNPAFLKILRLPDESPDAASLVDWLHQGRFAKAAQAIDLSHDHRGHCELVSSDGQVLDIRASKLPDDGRVWLLADVTERRKMSDRLQQIDRIETLGKVAGDAAHDFANILSTIRTHAHLLETRGHDDTSESLDAIGNAVDLGGSLTDRLLAFARKQSLTPEVVDLNALVEGMADLVEIGLKPNVQLDIALSDKPLHVRVDPGQLESALLNLLLNANNAISDIGHIKVTLDQRGTDQAHILIEDDGHGMPLEVLDRAIEPFFTTREGEGGTGLGLSIVYGFIRQTGGQLNIESETGRGTQIEVLLPLAVTDEVQSRTSFAYACLLVEDDSKTRAYIRKLLVELGYDVTTSDTGHDAMILLKEKRFDLLLSDLDLGGTIDGLDLVKAAWRGPHNVKTIIMSGKSSAKTVVPDHTAFIEKPVTSNTLAEALKPAQDS